MMMRFNTARVKQVTYYDTQKAKPYIRKEK